MKLEVLVADDHAIIRDGLRKILEDTDDLTVAGEAANGIVLLEKVRERDWDLVVMDMSMPGRNGLELIKMCKAERPRLPIMVFSMHPEEQYAVRAMRAGASAYVSKDSDSDLLLPAMRRVAHGGVYISDKTAQLLAAEVAPQTDSPPHTRLSNREFEVFSRIVRGCSLTEIGEDLSLSIKTISTHKSHILSKMNLSSQVDLIRYALEHRLLDN